MPAPKETSLAELASDPSQLFGTLLQGLVTDTIGIAAGGNEEAESAGFQFLGEHRRKPR